MAASIVAAKMRTKTHNRIAHVEGGLRSRDWAMPEEVNRVVTDAVADLLLTPSHDATENLEREGIPREKIRFVGNVMIDTLLTQLPTARATNTLERLGLRRKNYVAATLHRPSNVDDPQTLGAILDGFALIAENVPVVLPLHPRTRKSIERHHLHARLAPLMIHEPFGYTEMLALTDGAQCVMTDSGGLQEETTALGVPCVTLREQTERPITITEGTNRLVHWPITGRGMLGAYVDAVAAGHTGEVKRPDGWDGHAAERVVEALVAAS
jgi:UDP-N-acetylglucosamine 2-epimerase (non-hydrolysing)